MNRKVATSVPQALRAQKMPNGKWRRPKYSGRKAAAIRRQAILNGKFKQTPDADLSKGEWSVHWDHHRVFYVPKPNKGHKADRVRAERADAITKALEAYDKRVEQERLDKIAAKPTNMVEWLKTKDMWPTTSSAGQGRKGKK